MAVRAGESVGIRPSRTCGSSLGIGSDRCSNFIARSRNCSEVSIKNRRGHGAPCPYRILARFGAAVSAVARATKPGPIIEDHRLVADRTVRRLFSRQAPQDVEIQIV